MHGELRSRQLRCDQRQQPGRLCGQRKGGKHLAPALLERAPDLIAGVVQIGRRLGEIDPGARRRRRSAPLQHAENLRDLACDVVHPARVPPPDFLFLVQQELPRLSVRQLHVEPVFEQLTELRRKLARSTGVLATLTIRDLLPSVRPAPWRDANTNASRSWAQGPEFR